MAFWQAAACRRRPVAGHSTRRKWRPAEMDTVLWQHLVVIADGQAHRCTARLEPKRVGIQLTSDTWVIATSAALLPWIRMDGW